MRKALPQADLRRSWRWRLGDGTMRTGDTVTHAYRRPGEYKATVESYVKGYGWQQFDSVTVTIGR
jgi:PKD repeat protein